MVLTTVRILEPVTIWEPRDRSGPWPLQTLKVGLCEMFRMNFQATRYQCRWWGAPSTILRIFVYKLNLEVRLCIYSRYRILGPLIQISYLGFLDLSILGIGKFSHFICYTLYYEKINDLGSKMLWPLRSPSRSCRQCRSCWRGCRRRPSSDTWGGDRSGPCPRQTSFSKARQYSRNRL